MKIMWQPRNQNKLCHTFKEMAEVIVVFLIDKELGNEEV